MAVKHPEADLRRKWNAYLTREHDYMIWKWTHFVLDRHTEHEFECISIRGISLKEDISL